MVWVAAGIISLLAIVRPIRTQPQTLSAESEPVGSIILAGPTSDESSDSMKVLFGDGNVPYPNPFTGTQHENIFTGRLPSATATSAFK